jgi:hypothetical protein
VVWFELFSIFSPDDIKLDLTSLLNITNFGLFSILTAPCGRLDKGYHEMERSHFARLKPKEGTHKFHDGKMYEFITRYRAMFFK